MEKLRLLADKVVACTACPLHRRRLHLPSRGPSDSPIMVVGLAPSLSSAKGRRMYGGRRGLHKVGELLDQVLKQATGLGIEQTYVTSVVKCPAPGKGEPTQEEMDSCRRFLEEEQILLRPRLVIALGVQAARRLVDRRLEIMAKGRGTLIRRVDGSVVVATYHPEYALRRGLRDLMVQDIEAGWREASKRSL